MLRLPLLAVLTSVALPVSALEFNRDIRPILSERCFASRGPDNNNRKAGLRLDQEAPAKAELHPGKTPIVPGDPARSQVIVRVTSANKVLRMPPAYAGHEALPDAHSTSMR